MPRNRPLALLLLATVSVAPAAAQATEDFGIRVGGYGFRDSSPDGATVWTDSRMDGLGLFVSRSLGHHVFAEVGLDLYRAHGEIVALGDMDRVSTHLSAAVGLRMFPGSLLSPYVQAGLGGEVTHVRFGHGPLEMRLYPSGFLGVGGDLRLGDHLRVGANARLHMMAHPTALVTDRGGYVHAPEFEPGAAGQAQLFARYEL